jgi:hypothetical protein
MRTVEIFALSIASFVIASLAAEWANRKVWPADYPSQGGAR